MDGMQFPSAVLQMGLLPRRDNRASLRMTFEFFFGNRSTLYSRSPGAGVETASFSALACERGPTQAAVARRLAQLEQHFGVRLFHRTTRKLRLTDDGQLCRT